MDREANFRGEKYVAEARNRPTACLHQIFEAQVARTPDAVAVRWKGRDITYQQLDQASTRLAQGLVAVGVGPETVVALATGRGPELLEGILGVFKAGGAYLPLDPSYPAQRLRYMVEDSGVELLLVQDALREQLPSLSVEHLGFESCRALGAESPIQLPRAAARPESLAYVIYTSGSTGKPKGVLVSHKGIANLAEVEAAAFGAGVGKRILQFAPASFDASVFEILMAFHTGATLVLEDRQSLIPGPDFIELLQRECITHLLLPPSVLGALPFSELPLLENLVCAGETLPAHLVSTWGRNRRLFNAYGPTEATVAASMTICAPTGDSPSIGVPLEGMDLYVVGPDLELLGSGQTGELLISAVGLARGYLGRPGLTAERFIPDPFSTVPGERSYRSGDAVRWRLDGALDFAGRVDHQLKIHGHRIEPGEIEAALMAHPAVGLSLVLAHRQGMTEELVAYVSPRAGFEVADVETADLPEHLAKQLPSYMIPSTWMILEDLPLTPNGKVERASLPAPRGRQGNAIQEAELDPHEATLIRLCEELLSVEGIGVEDDLFSLGGHSLLMGRLVARIRGALGAELTLAEVFATPTVAGLAARLRQGRSRRPLPPIHRMEHDEPAPLSFPQERVWFLNELAPGNVAYNSQATMTLQGDLHPRHLQAALSEIVRRHEVFRSRFPAVGGSPVQEVMPPLVVPLPLLDLSRLTDAERGEESERLVRRALSEPFDLLQVPLARWVLMRLALGNHILIQVEHHFVHDGWSFGVLLREMQALYTAFVSGLSSPLPEPPIQGSDFALWQRQWLREEVLEEYLEYWVNQLKGSAPSLDLPTDYRRPKAQSFRGDAVRIELGRDFADGLRALAQREGVTLFTVMLAGFKALLHRYSGQQDILVGTAAANRRLEEVEHMLGMVVNTLVLRSNVQSRQLFSQLLQRVGETSLGAYAYQDMPLDKLIERLDPERDLSRNPLFQVMFSFHDSPVPDLDFAGLTGEVTERHNGSAKADLNIVGIPRAEQRLGEREDQAKQGITLIWEYSTDLFSRESMERMVAQYQCLLSSAMTDGGQTVGGLDIFTPEERQQLTRWNRTSTDFARGSTLPQLFETAVDRHEDAMVVVAGDVQWSYGHLDAYANRLAHYLKTRGIGTGHLVAIAMESSPELLLAVLAVTKTGAAYLPLDPHHPVERLSYILRDSQVPTLLTHGSELADSLGIEMKEDLPPILDLSKLRDSLDSCPAHRLDLPLSSQQPAYVIYTSGSTGKPKGSVVPHRGAVNLVTWHLDAFGVDSHDRGSMVASPSFDASVWEIWPYLAAGASLHIPPYELRSAPGEMYHWLSEQKITVAFLPTALGEALLEEEQPSALDLRILLLGGDRLRRPPMPGLPFRVFNNYGLTEDSVVATSGEVEVVDSGDGAMVSPSIGSPISNHRTYVLDPFFEWAPVGVPGELFIAGEGLAQGYLGRPALTAERFLPDPFVAEGNGGGRLYRTGDRARWLGQGELQYLGRSDHQVQIRGFRVEPGEIEAALQQHGLVKAAAVLPSSDHRHLVGFVVCSKAPPQESVFIEALRRWLSRSLPEYMVPARLSLLNELPLSPTGKVDRRELARRVDEDLAAVDSGGLGGLDNEPRSATEEMIAGVWSSFLGREKVGLRDDFFALGGHSLLATRILAKLRDLLAVDLPLRALFEWPTVERLARAVEQRSQVGTSWKTISQVSREGTLALSFGQERLWFLDRLIPQSSAYHICRAYEVAGDLDVSSLQLALRHVSGRHESLRTTFGELGGRAVQRVEAPGAKGAEPGLPVIDLSFLDQTIALEEAARLRCAEGKRSFQLDRLPLHRWTLLRLGAKNHQLQLTFHHIITDGWSTGLLLQQLSEAYGSSRKLNLPGPAKGGLDYADFASWQRQSLDAESLEELLAYWRKQLEGAPAVLELPLDRPRPKLQSFQGGQVREWLSPARSNRLRMLARESGTTWFMALLAAFGAVLGRLSGQSDVVVGSPVAGRIRPELDSIVGLFVNTLALRLELSGRPTFLELLGRSRQTTLGALAHQALPFERLVAELEPERDLSHSPVFQVLLVPGEADMETLSLPGLETRSLEVSRGESQFDLALFTRDGDQGLELVLRYDSALFDPGTPQRVLGQLVCFLEDVIDHPGRGIQHLNVLTAPQRQAVLLEWNDTARAYPRDQRIHQAFEARVETSPAAIALVTATHRLSYEELNRRANQLAHQLREVGTGPGILVGVHLGRKPEMIIAVLAVLKAGGTYVPMESSWPAERCQWILSRKGIEILITAGECLAELRRSTGCGARRVVLLDRSIAEDWEGEQVWTLDDVESCRDTPPPAQGGPEDLAYILFTSGSTGRPKGVMVRHRPVIQLIQWVTSTFDIGPDDRFLYTTALSFDLSVYDIFGCLAAGATIRLASEAEMEDPQQLVDLLVRGEVTFWDSAPAALQRLVPLFPSKALESNLRLVFLSGDWIPLALPDQVRETFPKARVISLGGATEATVWSNVFPVGEVDPNWSSIPYGRPIDNARYFVLDEVLEPCPIGVAGDLYIAGDVLSSGYFREAKQTAQSYLPDPFPSHTNSDSKASMPGGAHLYRTGDRARFWNDGTLEFLGRKDSQVKVRGYRIELGEIEAVLAEHPDVETAVVLVREDTPGDQRLVGYFTSVGARPVATEALLRIAKKRLPEYMVPHAFVHRTQWPLSATGKLDRRALPAPASLQTTSEKARPSPRSFAQQTIARVWKEVIGIEEVGVEDNFFDLGGHSLLVAQVHSRLQEEFRTELSMAELFRYPTVATLAEALAPEIAVPEDARQVVTVDSGRVSPAIGDAGLELDGESPLEGAMTSSGHIAIIGMAGRFAGSSNLDDFWQGLREGRALTRTFTDQELLAAGVPPSLVENPRYVKTRGALEEADHFDASFFGYAPREAEVIDPQQRLFMETAWQSLEDAGYIDPLPGHRVGVFAGVSSTGYGGGLLADPDVVGSVGGYQITISNAADYLPTRVSYKLNLTGPSINVQTACSTSLAAVHLAVKALQAGDCELALAGGVCALPQEKKGYLFESGGIASPDGRTRAFDAEAAGTVGGSGVGAVVLKRLEEALADGDTIRAVIRGSALTNDGSRKVGFTAPSVDGQAEAIRQALNEAGVTPESIGYVEAHGTATAMGDPIEVAALQEVFPPRANGSFCGLGSVKSNIGHLDAAAGIAGLMKTVLALQQEEIPASLFYETPNPKIDFDSCSFSVERELRSWPSSLGEEGARPRRAGVSSFGIGGTNAHVIVEEAPGLSSGALPSETGCQTQLLVLSAKTPQALEEQGTRLASHLEANLESLKASMASESSESTALAETRLLADTAFTLQVGRRPFQHRRAIVCSGIAEAVEALKGRAPEKVESRVREGIGGDTVFLFPGQGAQYAAMGAQLYEQDDTFRQEVDRCLGLVSVELRKDLERVLLPPPFSDEEEVTALDARLQSTALAQPALFILEYALAKQWMAWGAMPEALLGHSLGEWVAACLAGVFQLEDALHLVVLRGRWMEEMEAGDMLAVSLPAGALLERLEEMPGLEVAAVNGQLACTVSGSSQAIGELSQSLSRDGIEVRFLHTSHAFHSAAMEPMLKRFFSEVSKVDRNAPGIPFLSNVTGTWITEEQCQDPRYWTQHLRSTVRFHDGLSSLLSRSELRLLEIGPGRQLATFARQHSRRDSADLIQTTLPHPRNRGRDLEVSRQALGNFWLAGGSVEWAILHGTRRRRIPLPTYPFERRRYLIGPTARQESARPLEVTTPKRPSLSVVPAVTASLSPIETSVAEIWRTLLGVEDLRGHDDFFDLGGSSLMAIRLGQQLEQGLGVNLPLSTLLEASTLAALARRVEEARDGEGVSATASSCLVSLQQGVSEKRPLFLVHQVGGQPFTFRALAKSLGSQRSIYAFRSLGLEAGEPVLGSIESMASHYLELMLEAQPRGPFYLGGASMGGMVAYEMAQQLMEQGEEVEMLVLMDTPCLDQMPAPEDSSVAIAAVFGGHAGIELDPAALRAIPDAQDRLNYALEKAAKAAGGKSPLSAEQAERYSTVLETNAAALYRYQPQESPGRIVLLRALERRIGDPQRPELAWVRLARGGLDFVLVPGNHLTMHQPPHVKVAAAYLRSQLEDSDGRPPRLALAL